MTPPRPMIVGNWKMHGLLAQIGEIRALAAALDEGSYVGRVVVCPPATLLVEAARALRGSLVELGAQDCHDQAKGAFTGDLSAEMLADAGARLVILGHSERRSHHGETDQMVASKVRAALRAGVEPIVCVGEQIVDRRAGRAEAVVTMQIEGSLPDDLAGRAINIAYEPVWAIGSGLTPNGQQIGEVHRAIRAALVARFQRAGETIPILYGGSVKPANAAEVLATPGVDGALVGGASLIAAEFLSIVRHLS